MWRCIPGAGAEIILQADSLQLTEDYARADIALVAHDGSQPRAGGCACKLQPAEGPTLEEDNGGRRGREKVLWTDHNPHPSSPCAPWQG